MPFTGFPREGVKFFRELAVRQDRDWFKANKARYAALWEQPMKALLDDVAPQLSKQYRGVALEPPKHFRIYRDVRFSKDKSPFKTNVAAMIGFPGGDETGAPAALYLHLGLEDTIAAGHWMLPPDKVKRYREVVADEQTGRALIRKVDVLEKKGFTIDSMESLKRVPPGFAPDHPRARLLKLKGLGVMFPKPPAAVRNGPKLAKWIVEQSALVAPLITWLEERLS